MDLMTRKRKAMLRKAMHGKKKEVKKPALIVKKVDGEYTVQMEILKKFSRERLPFQYPYEDKQPEIFSVGRTAAENDKRKKRMARHQRREERRKSQLIQSTFRNMCEEICMRKYREAIGILPKPDPNDPRCPCFPESPDCFSIVDSCSCEDSTSESSTTETDGDDWVIEFTPPNAKFDALAQRPPLVIHEETQYSYLDFRVKLYDKNGVLIPRFIKGPDGKEVCTDLGGFWSPGHEQWLEINEHGWVSMNDVRWVPNEFIGPDGVVYNSEEGHFVDGDGRKFIIGTDGYVKMGKWYFYPPGPMPPYGKPKSPIPPLDWTCLNQYTLDQIISSDFLPHGKDRVWLKQRLDEEVRMTGSTELKMPTGKVVPYFNLKRLPKKDHMLGLKSRKSSVTFNLKDSKIASRKIGFSEARGDRTRSPPLRPADRGWSPPVNPGVDRLRSPPISPGRDRVRSQPASPGVRSQASPEVRSARGAAVERAPPGSSLASTSPARDVQGGKGKAAAYNKANQEKTRSPPKSPRRSSPRPISSRLLGIGLDIDYSKMSEKRAKALKFILDPKNRRALESKKVCKLARMLADGRQMSGRHKNCFGHSAGDCCTEYGGICMEIFKIAHDGQSVEEHEAGHGHDHGHGHGHKHGKKSAGKDKTKSKGRKSNGSPTSSFRGKATTEKDSSPPKSPVSRKSYSSPMPHPSGAKGVSKLNSKGESSPNGKPTDGGATSSRRERVINQMTDRRNQALLELKKEARMMPEGRHLSGHHKDCYGERSGSCK